MTAAGGTPSSPPLTIAQLAELAGVSTATVSKVVNGRTEVAPETRALIEGLIREHGYRPQRRVSPAPLVELVFHALEGDYPIEIAKGVEQVARDHQLAVVLSELQHRHIPGKGWIEGVLSRRPTGVIAVFSGLNEDQRDQLATRGVPLVLLDPLDDPGPQVSVGASNWNGGLAATRHLLDLGHRRIAIITGPDFALSSRARLDGYRTALDMAGVAADPALIGQGDFTVEGGLAQAERLLRLPDPPTAIFACNDGQAMGVYRAAYRLGLRIPDDLSVVGFDDLPSTQWTTPPLTTIRQPLAEMAAAATTMLLKLAQGEPLTRPRIELGIDLVVRESTARLRNFR
ncbi:LacI family transcriptional regulator/LacI family transcriptional regulator, xylobiose transport system transcriptional regulator [Nonomuraea solani]|uniref:LacI family transcriptional regulator/LacI family transcriptional regulator, xylobiose transport system transcriptional regulator n=1 Tax=Nonomuraea solani TaxID=1144553 RepID=A0A1H6EY15_9ACTN|nr:LacI family DNA-binding transcriptional regulator [Nonomuraea solani]SEH01835.1 LacI family transcriptional regulator/LacI family transcriptional regulator, xylobiose transport system transcriptional regulator [Nonomuraea solani]